SQWAARVPSAMTDIEGKSAGLANQLVPRATVFGADQPCGPRTEKRSKCPLGEAGSSQLMKTRPSGPTARLGSPLPAAAGDLSSTTVGAGTAKKIAETRRAMTIFMILPFGREATNGVY